jgi:hypothetical protein
MARAAARAAAPVRIAVGLRKVLKLTKAARARADQPRAHKELREDEERTREER